MHKQRLTKSQIKKMKNTALDLVREYPVLLEQDVINHVEAKLGLKVTITGNKNILWFDILNAYRSGGGRVMP